MQDDHNPPVEALGFSPIRRDVLREPMHHFHTNITKHTGNPKVSFIRLSNKRQQLKDIYEGNADRPNYSNPFVDFCSLTVSAYGVVLVAGLNYRSLSESQERHDLCLYFIETIPELEGVTALPVNLEDLLQTGYIFHTIRHFITPRPNMVRLPRHDFLWNLPCTYWPLDGVQLTDVRGWIEELQGGPVQSQRNSSSKLWDRMQIVMGYLKAGRTYEEAQRAGKRPWEDYSRKLEFLHVYAMGSLAHENALL